MHVEERYDDDDDDSGDDDSGDDDNLYERRTLTSSYHDMIICRSFLTQGRVDGKEGRGSFSGL